MQKFDGFFTRLVHFIEQNRDYVLWVTTSMGQEATETRSLETELYLVDPAKFTAAMGLEPIDWEPRPAMLPQWNVFVRPDKVTAFREGLAKLSINGTPLNYREAKDGFFSLDFGHPNVSEDPGAVNYGGAVMPLIELGLKTVEIEDKSGANAYHIPQGSLLVFDADHPERNQKQRPQISTMELAPTILKNYSVPIPDYMVSPVRIGS
jgi:hypothetical protein